MRVHYNSRLARCLPSKFDAFAFGGSVYVKRGVAAQKLLLHEAQHVLQFRKYGKLGFLLRYLWYLLRYGYTHSPLEVAARNFAADRCAVYTLEENQRLLDTL